MISALAVPQVLYQIYAGYLSINTSGLHMSISRTDAGIKDRYNIFVQPPFAYRACATIQRLQMRIPGQCERRFHTVLRRCYRPDYNSLYTGAQLLCCPTIEEQQYRRSRCAGPPNRRILAQASPEPQTPSQSNLFRRLQKTSAA